MQAPSDNEGIRSYWPWSVDLPSPLSFRSADERLFFLEVLLRFGATFVLIVNCFVFVLNCFSTKGNGEMQEQELRRGCTKCYARIKIPITLLAHPCIIFSVLSLSLYLLISEVILVCDLLFSSQSVPSLILLYT